MSTSLKRKAQGGLRGYFQWSSLRSAKVRDWLAVKEEGNILTPSQGWKGTRSAWSQNKRKCYWLWFPSPLWEGRDQEDETIEKKRKKNWKRAMVRTDAFSKVVAECAKRHMPDYSCISFALSPVSQNQGEVMVMVRGWITDGRVVSQRL